MSDPMDGPRMRKLIDEVMSYRPSEETRRQTIKRLRHLATSLNSAADLIAQGEVGIFNDLSDVDMQTIHLISLASAASKRIVDDALTGDVEDN